MRKPHQTTASRHTGPCETAKRRRRTAAGRRAAVLLAVLVLLLAHGVALALFCPYCGKAVKPEMKFCPHCGRKLPEVEAPKTQPAQTQPAQTQPVVPPATRPIDVPQPPLPRLEISATFDQDVQKAIDQAVKFLWSTQRPDGTWTPIELILVRGEKPGRTRIGKFDEKDRLGTMPFPVGTTALMCFALLESGVSPKDPQMVRSLRWLAQQDTTKTYSLGLRANVWQAASKHGADYHKLLVSDVTRLVKGTNDGSYSYECPIGRHIGDNSNGQYGLLGVWAGAKAHLEVPRQYWQIVMQYWVDTQNPDGGWAYRSRERGDSYASMTAAGLASLYVCTDNLLAERFAKCGVNPKVRPIEKGLNWLAENIDKVALDSTVPDQKGNDMRLALDTYYLFSLERIALASGYKRFGKLDWYRAGGQRILQAQRGDGSVPPGAWGDLNVGTAYGVLFLARGRNPVVFNKLEFDGDWNNRPHDMAVLTRWLSSTFERTLNWQIVRVKDPVEDWHDAPLLYISAAGDPHFTDEQLQKLRLFVDQGGTLFSVTECSGRAFRTKIREAYRKMFPHYDMEPMKPSHEMFRVHFRLTMPSFFVITNGVRPLAIHCDYDLPMYWQQRRHKTQARLFQVAANVAMYATGKGAFAPRGVRRWPLEGQFTPVLTVKLAKLQHAGNWDPEPLAHERLRLLLGQRHRIRLDVAGPVAIADLAKSGARLATLTGTGELSLTAAEKDALKAFVTGGGTLVVDAAGGDEAFYTSARALLESIFGARSVRTLSAESELFKQEGLEIKSVAYRGTAEVRVGKTGPPVLQAILIAGRPGVLLSREDITGALVGYPSATCDGYQPDSAFEIMRNIVRMAAQ
jgi:hypothetical protein